MNTELDWWIHDHPEAPTHAHAIASYERHKREFESGSNSNAAREFAKWRKLCQMEEQCLVSRVGPNRFVEVENPSGA